MANDVIVVKSALWDTLQTAYLMSIGDGFSYLWKQLMGIRMSSLVYFIFLLVALKILFVVLKHFGVMKKD